MAIAAVRVQVPLRVLFEFIRLCKSLIYEAFFFFNWQITGNISCFLNVYHMEKFNEYIDLLRHGLIFLSVPMGKRAWTMYSVPKEGE